MKRRRDDEDGLVARLQHLKKAKSPVDDAVRKGVAGIFRGLKLARGFERQKIGRRQKAAREQDQGEYTSRLETEVTVLKELELYQVAEFHFYKTLLRATPPVFAHPKFPPYIAEEVERTAQPRDAIYLDLYARLFKSSPVRTAVDQALNAVYDSLRVKRGSGGKKRLRKADFDRTVAKQDSVDDTAQGPIQQDDQPQESNEPDIDAAATSDVDMLDQMPMVANLSRDHTPSDRNILENENIADEVDDSSSFSEQASIAETATSKPRKPDASHSAPTTTAFLPSLATGYFSGSGSDVSDDEDYDKKPRRNRLGQQARRALWERKYGAGANHVKKRIKSRDHGWDPRRGAQEDSGRRPRAGGRDHSGMATRKSNAQVTRDAPKHASGGSNVTKKTDAGPLHPSWEAAKKLKEQKAQTAFQGKKVVFD